MNYIELPRMPSDTALIYKISSVDSTHAYIGSTIEPQRRWTAHKKLLRNGIHTSFVLQRAWDKHGEKSFTCIPLLVCAKNERFFYENRAIQALGSYNLIKTAGQPPAGAMLGLKHTKEGIANLKVGATKRWAAERLAKYDPLCELAWKLVESGMPKYKACKSVKVSHTTFWKWIAKNELKEWWNR